MKFQINQTINMKQLITIAALLITGICNAQTLGKK